MRETASKIAKVFVSVCLLVVLFSIASYLIQSYFFGFKSKQASRVESKPQILENFGTDNDDFDYSPQTPPNEDDDVYAQRQLRADENNSFKDTSGPLRTSSTSQGTAQKLTIYHVGAEQITTNNGITVSTVIYNQGNYFKEHYGYSEYNPAPKSNGIYADVVISLENISKTPVEINMTKINFIDQYNRVFIPIKKDGSCGVQNVVTSTNINELLVGTGPKNVDEIIGELNPNVPCSIRILFEVASSSLPRYIEFLSN